MTLRTLWRRYGLFPVGVMGPRLKRALHDLWRAVAPLALGILLIRVSGSASRLVGDPAIAAFLPWLGWAVVAVGIGHLARRLLFPYIEAKALYEDARRGRIAASVVLAALIVFVAVISVMVATRVQAAEPPKAALQYLPMLRAEKAQWWSDMPLPSTFGGQVEQETCPSLTHRKCWNPRAELRTSRERGVGLGQITAAYRADGSTRFDALAEMRAAFPQALGAWSWDKTSLYDPRFQLRGLVLKDRQCWSGIRGVQFVYERVAMSLVCYNAGAGRVISDRKVCDATPGCDSSLWFGHVEHTSRLTGKPLGPEYGTRSALGISREYPRNILQIRRLRYIGALEG